MTSSTLLMADVVDWIRVLIPVVFVIIWVISQVMRGGGDARRQQSSTEESDEDYDWYEEEEVSRGDSRSASDPLANEIEAFLQKVRGGQPVPSRGRREDSSPVTVPVVTVPVVTVPPVRATIVEAIAGTPAVREDVADRFSAQTSRLGSDVGQADERAERHRHEAFDHTLGSLADTSVGVGESGGADVENEFPTEGMSVPTTASEFRELLSTPESIRKAVVLNEILSRPINRW